MHRVVFGVATGVLVLLSAITQTVRAEETDKQGKPQTTMEEVVVTASREAETVAKVPAHVTVIDAKEIEQSNAQNVPEVLAAAGLHVSDVAGNNRSYAVDLRGFGESAPANLLVLVDGRRINAPDLSGTDWTLIPLERIERIEVVPGSRGSVLYGDNATGGVINIITKKGAANAARGAVQYGSYDTFKGMAGGSATIGMASLDLTGSYLKSDGYRDNSDTEAKDAGIDVGLDPNEKVSLDFSGGYHKDDTRLPGAILQSEFDNGAKPTDTFHPDDFANTQDYYGKAGVELFFLTQDAFKIDLGYRSRDVSQYASFEGGWFAGDSTINTITLTPHLTFQENFGDVSNRVVLGMDYALAKEDVTNTSEYFSSLSIGQFNLDKENSGYYINDDLGITPNLTFSAGYRYDNAKFNLGGNGTSDSEAFNSDQERIFDEEAYSFGLNYALSGAKVYVNYGSSFRYPLIDELFSYFTNEINAQMQPQTSRQFEVGTRLPMTEHMGLNINLFNIETEEEIFYNPVTYSNENLDGDTLRRGFEVGVDYRRNGWSGGATYTQTHASIEDGTFSGATIPDVPEHRASANIGYAFDMGLALGLNGIYVGDRYLISDFNNVYKKQDPYTVINANGKYDWRWLTFFVNLNNIFNQEYASYGGVSYNSQTFTNEPGYYPSPKFNILAGISARFGGK
ncbi:MAG: TonB-dependent receptor [Desulfobacteraceae bacterium]|nr:TonB-dependent receptor [Desulfobacteraceae bacterium]